MKQYRNEWKFLCGSGIRAELMERVRQALTPDIHAGPNSSYLVHSVYFDDLQDSCAAANEAGGSIRFKYRVRGYGGSMEGLHLERKEKLYGRCAKESCPLSVPEFRSLLAGEAQELFWQTENPLMQAFCLRIMTAHFTPKLTLSYERAAFTEPAANIRVTFDSSIRAAIPDPEQPVSPDSQWFRLIPEDRFIMEVKFDSILPGWIRNMLELDSLQQVTFSKYYLGRKTLEEIYT